jgi:hypothetical protein
MTFTKLQELIPKELHDKEMKEAKAIIQRQAELISYFINEYPQTKDLAKIKTAFEEVNHGKSKE